jgi:hypothetical protein
MEFEFGFDWLAMSSTLFGQYLIMRKRWYGFMIHIIGSIVWVMAVPTPDMLISSSVYSFISLRGIYNWKFRTSTYA